MKAEDDANEPRLQSLSPEPAKGSRSPPLSDVVEKGSWSPPQPAQSKRAVCDHCRRRRIRCDGQLPCQPCINAALACKRDHVPLKRGPKRGRGRVINELRERYSVDGGTQQPYTNGSMTHEKAKVTFLTPPITTPPSPPAPTDISWQHVEADPRHAPEPSGTSFPGETYGPASRGYLPLMPQCVELYYEHIYPIMPLPYMPVLRAMVAPGPEQRELLPSEKTYVYALCALTCLHMSGQNIVVDAPPTPSWECAGRFFLDECIAARQSYDFYEDGTLQAVISSFWLSTSFFEINQSRKSWLYLREALTLAQELRLHEDASYVGLDPPEKLCRQRAFWQLLVTERSFAILRSKPITLKKTPSLPTSRHPYEAPEIHTGFLQLIGSYAPLDEAFVNAWNEGSDPSVTGNTYLALQNLLAMPPTFLSRPATAAVSVVSSPAPAPSPSPAVPVWRGKGSFSMEPKGPSDAIFDVDSFHINSDIGVVDESEADLEQINIAGEDGLGSEAEPTAIQKADLLITQQWLRLIVWQSSFRQQLLSWTSPDESMRFAFPLTIASRTASVLQSLPPQAIEVHGMGIFEKIFEISTWCMNVLQACDAAGATSSSFGGSGGGGGGGGGSGGLMGMDFAGAGDLGLLGLSRMSFTIDPLEFFVRTLSASPHSRTQYAERLLLFANDHPSGMRMLLSPALSLPSSPEFKPSYAGGPERGSGSFAGSVLGEVTDKFESNDKALISLPDPSLGFSPRFGGG